MFCKIINFSKREVKKVNILRSIFVQKVCSKLSFFTIVVDNIDKYARFFYSFIQTAQKHLDKEFEK